VLVPGKDHRLGSLEACRASCDAEAACTAWLHCWHPSGCDDGIALNTYWYVPVLVADYFRHTLSSSRMPHVKVRAGQHCDGPAWATSEGLQCLPGADVLSAGTPTGHVSCCGCRAMCRCLTGAARSHSPAPPWAFSSQVQTRSVLGTLSCGGVLAHSGTAICQSMHLTLFQCTQLVW
jgi:hypothetical protein